MLFDQSLVTNPVPFGAITNGLVLLQFMLRGKQIRVSHGLERTIAAIKKRFGDAIVLSVDVCLCPHLEHGHCGLIWPTSTSDGAAS